MRWTALLLLAPVLLLAAACEEEDKTDETPTATVEAEASDTPAAQAQPTATVRSQAAQEIDLRVTVHDDTVDRSLQFGQLGVGEADNRIELWVRGFGSWYPDVGFGSDVNTLGSFPVGEEDELFIYPDGRDGSEIRLVFRMTGDMISGSDRDTRIVEVSDTIVTVTWTALPDITQEFER